MKNLLIIFTFLISFNAFSTVAPLGDRGDVQLIANGVYLKTGEGFDDYKKAGRNPVYKPLFIDAQTTSYTTAIDASGTDYTPPAGREYHVRAVRNRVLTPAAHDWLMGTGTTILAAAGATVDTVYYMNTGSGFPRYFRCESIDVCEKATYDFIFGNGRYLWANVQSGPTRAMEVFGYEMDEL